MPYSLGDRYEARPSSSRIAQYARHKDYHKHLKRKALSFLGLLEEVFAWRPNAVRVAVDSAPILERSLAKRTQLGFIGKKYMLYSSI